MDRRFLTWLMLTTALCFLWLSLRQPPPPPAPVDEPRLALNDDPLLRDAAPPRQNPELAGDGLAGADAAVEGEAGKEAAGKEAAAPQPLAYPNQTMTLGSMDPDKGYNLLITLNSSGAAVERAELVGREKNGGFRYRALEHDGGYLGYLGLVESVEGMRLRVVPDGSPAALAICADAPPGLQPGDVLLEIDGRSINDFLAFQETLEEKPPGTEVALRIVRMVDQAPRQLNYAATLSQPPLDILRMRAFDSEVVEGNVARPSLRTTLGSIDGTRIPTGMSVLPALRRTMEGDWQTKPLDVPGGEGVEFRLALDSLLADTGRPAELDLVKRYRLLAAGPTSDGFILDLETVVENRGSEPVMLSLRQEGLAGLTLEGWWYSVKISPSFFSGAGARDVAYANEFPDSHSLQTSRELYNHALKNPAEPSVIILSESEAPEIRNLRYIGLDAQYFNASILPHPEQPQSLSGLRQAGAVAVANVEDMVKAKSQGTNSSFWFDTVEQSVAPEGGQFSQRYQIFMGPKDGEILATHGLSDAVEYGWFPWVAKPLGWILHFFYSIIRNYGLAIVMLTVCVRGAMFPLGRKAAMNAQRMAELQPELAKINEKFKDNMEKRAKAMQELYAKHNFKPLAGCLPMLIQIPIFIGLYRCLSVDISLRQAPLIPGMTWCSNLAGPDQLVNWSSWMPEFLAGRGTGWLGPYFNVLPIVTIALFLLQQRILMPKATDEQTRMTQNMMQFMTVFMGVLFFKVPSGLCIYFITSSLWSLVERTLVKRFYPVKLSVPVPAVAADESNAKLRPPTDRRSREPVAGKPKTKFQEMLQMLEKPAVRSATQRTEGPRPPRRDKRRKR